MARIGMNDVEQFNSGSRGFFTLKDDKDFASVRFMYESEDDIDVYSVHKVSIGGKDRYVSCLREHPNDPESKCPLCLSGNGRVVRMFLQVALVTGWDPKDKSVDTNWEVKIWDRGGQMVKKIQAICSRYKPLSGTLFEIERSGKAGDQRTDYQIFPITTDGLKLDELPKRKEILGSMILSKSFEDLDAYVQTGQFPNDSDNDDEEEEEVKPRGTTGRDVSANSRTDVKDDVLPESRGRQETSRGSQPDNQGTSNTNTSSRRRI